MTPQLWAAVISAVAGILGALLGAAVSNLASARRERERAEREDRIRFHEKRLAAGRDFMLSAIKLATGLSAGRGIKEEDVEAFAANELIISVLAGDSIRRSAAKLRLLLTKAQVGPLRPAEFGEKLRLLRQEFNESLRRELDVSSHPDDKMWKELAEEMESWSPDPSDKWHRELTDDPDSPPTLTNGEPLQLLGRRQDRGTVVLTVIIDSFGVVRYKEIVESQAGYQFTVDVLAAIDQCRFSPAKIR